MRRSILALLLWSLLLGQFAFAGIQVSIGPTPIPRGDALGEKDITVNNGLFAVAFAVDTAPPWGVARGGIVDIALVTDGEPGYDIASLADFMPNNWSSWPTTYQTVSINRQRDEEVIVKVLRDWGRAQLETLFTIRENERWIGITTRMTNSGDSAMTDLLSGYVVWPDGGHLFGVPGLPGVAEGQEDEATADWSAMYDSGWLLGLHAPFADYVNNVGRDRYLRHELQAGESRVFNARLQIEAIGSLAALVRNEIEANGARFGELSGQISTTDGQPVAVPALVVYKGGRPYAWVVGERGKYSLQLPVGDYSIYATAEGHSQSNPVEVTIDDRAGIEMDFDDLQPPGVVKFGVAGRKASEPVPTSADEYEEYFKPIDARISIEAGQTPLIRYMGKKVFFTSLEQIGEATISIAPGQYTFAVSAGDGFTSTPELIELIVSPGRTHRVSVAIEVNIQPSAEGWYSADLHHHSDVLDGFTSPEYVLRSELAAGLDVAFLSDHDSVVNNSGMYELAKNRRVPFIPATELSPSWAHFNAYPLHDGKVVEIDTGQATVQEVFSEARRMGAKVIAANHPYNNYGYFANLEKTDAVPGGYDDGFDLIEIYTGQDPSANVKALERAWGYWNDGQRKYLSGGSDAHDVWIQPSGSTRSYVYVEGELTIDKFISALRAGNSYASQGPLIFPGVLFGSDIEVLSDSVLHLTFGVHAVNGLRSVSLIERGVEVDRKDFVAGDTSKTVDFARPSLQEDTWFSLVVEDMNGRPAYSNPIWVNVKK